MSSTVTASARQYTAANSEYHSITDAAQTGLDPGDSNFYVAAWVRADSLGADRMIFTKWTSGGSNNAYQLGFNNTTGNFRWIGSTNGSGVAYNVNAGSGIVVDTWYFVEGYYDTTNNLFGVCVNRGTDSTTAATTGLFEGTNAVYIGAQVTGAGGIFPWNGKIGPVVVINGAIPAAADRDALYNSGNGVLYKDKPTLSSGTYVSWWDGAETSGVRIDAHGTNQLTDNNTVTSAAGKVTYTAEDASQFTAANSEYLSVATSGNLVPGDYDFTVTGWFYLDSSASDMGIASVLNYGGAFGNNYSWVVFYKTSTNVINFDVDSLGTVAAGYHRVSSTVALSTGKWFFFAARHDATANTIEVRTNLETWQSVSHSGGAYAGNAPFRISAYGITSVTAFFNGRIADVNYWNAKLSDANVEALYQRGFGRDYSEAPTTTGLVGWWELTEASGSRADSHGSFTLTDNNTVTGNPGVVYDVPAVSSTKKMMLLGVG